MVMSEDSKSILRKNSRESIHSGHFMVSDFEPDVQDEEGFEVQTVHNNNMQVLDEIKGVQGFKQGNVIRYEKSTAANQSDKSTVSITVDSSITNLFTTMSIAYKHKICSPKWNMFKGLKLRWIDKIRLNNVIWRCWHMQFIKRRDMTVCQFNLETDMHNKPEITILEGKYWKRRIEAVTAEYRKWRVFYKNRRQGIYMPCDTPDVSFFGMEEMDWGRSLFSGDRDSGEMDFMDYLFASPQQFHFPNPREIARGTENSDLLQPGLIQLQPDFKDEFVDFHEMLARDCLPTVPEEDFNFPEVEPPRNSPISTPQPQIEYTARLSLSNASQTPSKIEYDEFISQSPPNNIFSPFQNQNLDLSLKSSASDTSRQDYSPDAQDFRVIERSHSHQDLPRGQSSVDQPGSFIVPKAQPYSRRRSHSGSVPPQNSNVVIQHAQPPIAGPSLSPHTSDSSFTFGHGSQSHQRFQQPPSALLALLNPENRQINSAGRTEGFKLYLPNANQPGPTVPNFLNTTTIQNVASVNKPNTTHSPNVTLTAVTPSSIKTTQALKYSSSSSASSFSSLPSNTSSFPTSPLKPSPPHPASEPSPPLASIPSPTNKPFRPKNDIERVQYKEHRRKCHISAEQKRRCNIKSNFDTLHSLIPSVSQNSHAKVSKATMLNKGADYIQQLKLDKQKLQEKAETLRNEIEMLNVDITAAQAKLPATGAPLTHTRHNKLKENFEDYVRNRTLQNWKFYIFSLVAEPLLESFSSTVSTANIDDLCRTSMGWLDQHCSLNVLRPVVSNSMRRLSTSTSILTTPEILPKEATNFVTKKENSRHTSTSNYDR